ncbi:MAG: asparagine synthase [Gammaproteobacteria bacterium]|nr:asparagine synthase [Gammaproteobacteria bacterium]
MTGICGWYHPVSGDFDAQAVIQDMAAALSDFGDRKESLITDCCSVASREHRYNGIACSSDGSITVLLSGRSWLHTDEPQPSLCSAGALLELYNQKGLEFLAALRGSFALTVIDQRSQKILLAVDRYGIKPLAYSDCDTNGVVFGSTATSVAMHPQVARKLDMQAIYNYIYFHVIPSPRTIFQSVKKLPPAHYALWEQGNLEVKCYWKPEFAGAGDYDFPALKAELDLHLKKAIARQYAAGKTGAYLSGGIDSSTVSGLLAQLDRPADVYSIGFEDEAYNEIGYARIASKHFGLQLHEYFVTTDDVLGIMSKVAQSYDEPFGNSSVIPAYFCAKMAKESGKSVMLGGDAGDELFGGNERYVTQKVFSYYYWLPRFVRQSIVEPLLVNAEWADKFFLTRKLRSYVQQARVPMPDRLQTYNFLHRVAAAEVFTDGFLTQIDTQEPIQDARNVYESAGTDSMLDRMLYLDWKITLADNDIRKVSHMAELAGIDVRYPFLDDDVVEFSTRVPPNLKIRKQYLRYFFKRAMTGFLPQEIINKSKHGFGLPFGVWLKTSRELQDFIYKALDALKQREIIKSEYITRIVDAHRGEHAGYYGTMVWVLAILELWLQAHVDQKN